MIRWLLRYATFAALWIGFIACAAPPITTAPVAKTATVYVDETQKHAQDVCIDLTAVLCTRLGECGVTDPNQCFSTQVPGCVSWEAVSDPDVRVCREKLMCMPCNGMLPKECRGIAVGG